MVLLLSCQPPAQVEPRVLPSDPGQASGDTVLPGISMITGDVFRCALKPVEQALQYGAYGDWWPDAAQRQRLQEDFPQGVCDHSRPGPFGSLKAAQRHRLLLWCWRLETAGQSR
ncbi:MAG: DUF6351 family protein [Pseudomonadota bacterium]